MVIRVTKVTAVDKLATLFISMYNPPIHVPHDNIKRRGTIFLHKINATSITFLSFCWEGKSSYGYGDIPECH